MQYTLIYSIICYTNMMWTCHYLHVACWFATRTPIILMCILCDKMLGMYFTQFYWLHRWMQASISTKGSQHDSEWRALCPYAVLVGQPFLYIASAVRALWCDVPDHEMEGKSWHSQRHEYGHCTCAWGNTTCSIIHAWQIAFMALPGTPPLLNG